MVRNICFIYSFISVINYAVNLISIKRCLLIAEQLEMFMKGQGESIIEDDDKGEDPDAVVENAGTVHVDLGHPYHINWGRAILCN